MSEVRLRGAASPDGPRLTVHGRWGADPGFALEGASERGVFLRRLPGARTAYGEGEVVWLNWSDADGRPLLQVMARLRHAGDGGLRLQFEPGQPTGLVEQVQALVPRRSLLDAAPDPVEHAVTVVVDAIRQDFVGACRALLQAAQADCASADGRAAALACGLVPEAAAARIAAAQADIESELRRRLTQPWRASAAALRRSPLQLVDEGQMRAWLAGRELARALERECASAWRPLREVLRTLARQREGLSADALAPTAVLDALGQALAGAGLEAPLQDLVLGDAATASRFDLADVYARLEQALRRVGLRAEWPAAEPVHAPPAGAHLAPLAHIPLAAPPPAEQAWATLRRLGAATAAGVDESLLPGGGAIADVMLLRAATEVLGARAAADEFRERLLGRARRLAGNPQAPLERRQHEAIDLVARLHAALAADPLLPAGFRERCRPLLQPLLAAELRGEGLGESSGPMRRLLGLVEFGSLLCALRSDAAAQKIAEMLDEELARLARTTPWTAGLLEQACERLDSLLQRQRSAAQAAEKRVVDTCEGQQRLAEARRQLHTEMARIFEARELPQALAVIIERRLASVLLPILLRAGVDSPAWREWVQRLQWLLDELQGAAVGRPPFDPESHLGWLREACAGPPDEQILARCVAQLQAALHGGQVPWLGWDASLLPAAGAEAEASAPPLEVGGWVRWHPPGCDAQMLKLAWHSPDGQRLVLVNRIGQKAEDIAADALREAIAGGHAEVIETGAADPAERAWRRLLIARHDELAGEATRDGLTGLPDRRELERHLQAWLLAPRREPLLLLWLGIDHLRIVNQGQGMAAGDRLLCLLADALRGHVDAAPGAFAARAAGDEFVLVLHGDAEQVEGRALALFERANALETRIDGVPLKLSLSMGLVAADPACTTIAQLLADAERACEAAKDAGRGRCYRHQPGDARLDQMREVARWVQRLDEALASGGLLLYGQRAQALAAGQPDYIEVLLRMRGEDGCDAAPTDFILAAERYGQIAAVDRHVLQELVRMLQEQPPAGDARIAFNVSARNIVDLAFVDEIVDTLRRQPLPLRQICVELTETAAIAQLDEASAGMQRLAAAGVALVLDDFGSGWSSYQYLRRLPFDVVKVDGAFIRDIASSAEDRAMARSINEIAHLLGKRTVAEHVEDEATLREVRELGFDYAQGYHLGRPRPLRALLQE